MKTPVELPLRPSAPIRFIAKLPFGRRPLLRIYNRALMHLSPRQVATTYFGSRFDCDVRDMIQGTIIHLGSWEPRLSATLQTLLEPGDVAIDVGANIGYYSLLFSSLVGPAGHVVAIEALPRMARILEQNVERNGAPNVRVVNVAVAAESGKVTLYEAPSTNVGMTTTRADRGFAPGAEVNSLPLSQILSHEEMRRTALIKIDIEGGEIALIQDILEHIERFSEQVSVAVEVSDTADRSWDGLFERFLALGFAAYDLRNEYDWLSLLDQPLRPPLKLTSPPHQQTDVLFTRRRLTSVSSA